MLRHYEQETGQFFDSSRLGEYVQRWVRWVGAGLDYRLEESEGCSQVSRAILFCSNTSSKNKGTDHMHPCKLANTQPEPFTLLR